MEGTMSVELAGLKQIISEPILLEMDKDGQNASEWTGENEVSGNLNGKPSLMSV